MIADQPELLALAGLAAVPASKMAAAFNEPERFFEHLDLEEIGRIQAACERWAILQNQMIAAMDAYTAAARKILETVTTATD